MLVCLAGQCRGRRFPSSGVCTYPVHLWSEHSIIGPMSFHVFVLFSILSWSAPCSLRCVPLSALKGQEYSSYVQWLCALQSPQAAAMGNIPPYVRATLSMLVHQRTGILIMRSMVVRSPEPSGPGCRDGQYTTLCVCHVIYAGPLIDSILNFTLNIMSCACFPRAPSRRSAVSSLRCVGLLSPLNGQEPNNVSCLCAFQNPVMVNPVQPQVCVYLPHPSIDGDTQ